MYRLFIVEDDSGIAEAIASSAEAWGLSAKTVRDFKNIIPELSEYDPHIVLLDISLPFFNGYHWCEEIRKTSKVPIIFISSASDKLNIVMAMNMGADDFIAKPFDIEVLTAKVNALLRRTYNFTAPSPMLEHRGVKLNTADNTAEYNGEKIELTKNEYRIMLTLMQNTGKTVSREKLMDALWKTDSFIDENTLTVNVGRLRKKLETAGIADFIETKFGLGYIIEA